MGVLRRVGQAVECAGAGAGWATYQFEDGLPKPCIHPIVTPGGVEVTEFEPADHVWQRGLWFAFKFVNGENFWEENPPFGVQRAGRTAVRDGLVEQGLEWVGAQGTMIDEERRVAMTVEEDVVRIDWSSRLTARRDVLLDRTVYTTWGGYGGLAFRARAMDEARLVTSGGQSGAAVTGDKCAWAALMGRIRGAGAVTVAMIDHPENERWPSAYYGKASGDYNFFGPAFLFHEPRRLAAGESLHLKYRVIIADGAPENELIETQARTFASRSF